MGDHEMKVEEIRLLKNRQVSCFVRDKSGLVLKIVRREIKDYLSGRLERFSIKPAFYGGPFAKRVLRLLAKVPYGQTITYGELARRAGCPGAARAVGNVMAHNRVPILLPCHRVVAKNGPGGFSAGKGWKKFLLNLECNGRGDRPVAPTRRKR
jgi:O-6-methylguanine DNA methyltransferase